MTSVKIFAAMATALLAMAMVPGCFENVDLKPAMDLVSPIVVLKGSTQWCKEFPEQCGGNSTVSESVVIVQTIATLETPALIPTVTVAPESKFKKIDPFAPGERFEGQWFKWTWLNASGYQSANRGITVYGHSYHDVFTYWNYAWGDYDKLYPPQSGMRFLAVYVHQEDFGPDDDGLWGYQSGYFYLQYDNQLHGNFTGYQKAYPILELETVKNDYYNIDRLKPYGINRIFIRTAEGVNTGGYIYEDLYSLRAGKGNSWDGYILYLVPVGITDNDIRIVGKFAGIPVNWRFDKDDGSSKTVEKPVVLRQKV